MPEKILSNPVRPGSLLQRSAYDNAKASMTTARRRAVRWEAVALPAPSKTGFTQLPPEQTGLLFTNLLTNGNGRGQPRLENGTA